MLSSLRRIFVESWLGRVMVIGVFLAFIGFGAGNIINFMGTGNDVAAKIGSDEITTMSLDEQLRKSLPDITKRIGVSNPAQIPPYVGQQAAYQSLNQLIQRQELILASQHSDIRVPDSAIRDEVFSVPAFHNAAGTFDRTLFNSVLSSNNMTEQEFLKLVHNDLAIRAVLQPVELGAGSSSTVARYLADYGLQTRVVDFLRIPFSDFQPPAQPSEAVLHRYYSNHPWLFQLPEYRHARIVVISPETIAKSITVEDKLLQRAYDGQKSHYNVPETRDVQIITLNNQDEAAKLAAMWKNGTNWAGMQAASKGSASVEMSGIRPSAIPSEALASAIFASPVSQIDGPVKTEAGWAIFRVLKIIPPKNTSFEQARTEILEQYRTAKAPQLISERSRQLQDVIASNGLDTIPSDIGAVAAAGSLDAQGNTQDKEPAPLPASGKLRAAIIQKIFSVKKGEQPNLIEGPDNSWYAVQVDEVTPARPRTFEQARQDVLSAWQSDMMRQAANKHATDVYLAAQQKGGVSAASDSPSVVKNASFSRSAPNSAIPQDLMALLMHMKAGQSAMTENDDSFIIATVTKVYQPQSDKNVVAMQNIRQSLARSNADDLASSYVNALVKKSPPQINNQAVAAVINALGFGGNTQR
ncbi:peptidylprolyl isomerase [Acetobacter thailandicus]|uniref:peptidylprolyl isomerase n=1 Tax=Acetobacter thailandicus TaxID=1502842 RepID=UPI001BA43DB4|nr:peptidylprolyl isomerase [Acetobacter thailandicus]MBS0959669.1 peptidyl-prolyl cis-trans isomerase [Acetobacter thailandicus]